jgi:hypothetical protein
MYCGCYKTQVPALFCGAVIAEWTDMLQHHFKRGFPGNFAVSLTAAMQPVPPPLPSLGTAGPCNFHQYLLGAPRVKTSESSVSHFFFHLVLLPSSLHFSVLFDFLIMYTQCTPISLPLSLSL